MMVSGLFVGMLIRSEKDNDNLYCSTAPDHERINDLTLTVTREM